MGARIKSVGSYLPKTVVNNDFFIGITEHYTADMDGMFDGACERRHALPEETARFMATQAAKNAIDNSALSSDDKFDLMLCFIEPSVNSMPQDGYLVARDLGLGHLPVMHINACCSSFVSMLNLGASLMKSKQYQRVLLVCSLEWINHGVDKTKNYCMVGDGAGAVVLEQSEEDSFIDSQEISIPEYFEFNLLRNAQYTGKKEVLFFSDDPRHGLSVLRQTPKFVREFLDNRGHDINGINWFICHQPGLKVLEMWSRGIGIDKDKNLNTFRTTANISAANIPVILDYFVNKEKLIKRGDTILFMAPGGGLHLSMVLWEY